MTIFKNSRVLTSLVSAVAMTSVVAACSGGGGGGAAPAVPLTPEQTAKLDLTAKNVSDVSNWETSASRSTDSRPFVVFAERTSEAAKAEIQKAVFDPSVCVVKVAQPVVKAPTVDPSRPVDMNTEMGVAIGGANCPIAFSWLNKSTQKMDPQSMAMTSDFAINYTGRTPQAQAFDIDRYQFAMGVTFNMNKDGGNGTVLGSGEINSRSQGKIVIQVSGDMQVAQESSTSTVVVRMNYPDGLVIEFKELKTQNMKTGDHAETYFINNSPVSEKVFKQYSKSFGMDKAESSSPESRTGSGGSGRR